MRDRGLIVLEVDCHHIDVDALGDTPIQQLLQDKKNSKWLHVPLSEDEEISLSEWDAMQHQTISRERYARKQDTLILEQERTSMSKSFF